MKINPQPLAIESTIKSQQNHPKKKKKGKKEEKETTTIEIALA